MKEMKNENFARKFNDFFAMNDFLKEVNDHDVWNVIKMKGSTIEDNEPESSLPFRDAFLACDEEDLDSLEKHGGYYLSTRGGNYIISPLAFFTLKQRLGITCTTASKLIDKKEYKKFADFSNIAFSIASEKDEATLLVRGNKVIAMHSGKYSPIIQSEIFKVTDKYLFDTFGDECEFVEGFYSHDLTTARWTLGDENSDVTKKYVDDWKESGLSVADLEGFHPIVDFATNDIGTITVSFYPKMVVAKKEYFLGEPVKIKHYAKNTTEDVANALNMVFAAMRAGSEKLGEMLKTEIEYPVEVFVSAAKKVGLAKSIPKILKEKLEEEKISYGICGTGTAFMIFDALSSLTTDPRYMCLKESSKIRVRENILRLINLDWKELDHPGARDFN